VTDTPFHAKSYGTLKACQFLSEPSLTFVHIKDIISVIGMVPHQFSAEGGGEPIPQQYFVVDMSKLDGAYNHSQTDGADELEDGNNDANDATE
jgi:hypothetical protein